MKFPTSRFPVLALPLLVAAWTGCGTTKYTDTSRSGTEQMLLSNSMDHAVSNIDLSVLAGKEVYLNSDPVNKATDSAYLVSTLRQHILASGCILREKEEEAEYVVEVRAGAIGTDRDDVLYGIPAVSIPAAFPVQGTMISAGQQIPEIPFVKKTRQRAITKIALFAYNRETGRPVWQSGINPVESEAKAWWVFGAGPIQRGQIYRGTRFAGEKVHIPQIRLGGNRNGSSERLTVFDQAIFPEIEEAPDARVASRPENESGESPAPPPRPAARKKRPETAPAAVPAAARPQTPPRTEAQPQPRSREPLGRAEQLSIPPLAAERWARTPSTGGSPPPREGRPPLIPRVPAFDESSAETQPPSEPPPPWSRP